MYYKFLYTVVLFVVNGKNKWMNEWMTITDYRNKSCSWFPLTCHYIDKIVVEAAAKYLRGVCGDTLDSYTGPNYEVSIN